MSRRLARVELTEKRAKGIRHARIHSGLTQPEIADIINVSDTAVRNVEQNRDETTTRISLRTTLAVIWLRCNDNESLEQLYRDHNLWTVFEPETLFD